MKPGPFTRGDDDEAFAKWAKQTFTPSIDDISIAGAHTATMSEISREELSAKLETIEVKMDARVESVSGKIDGFLAAQVERDKRLDAALAQIAKDNSETKSSLSSMKATLIVTAVSTVIAIVLGVAGFNTALTSNMMSAFQLGKAEQSSKPSESSAPSAAVPPAPPTPSNSKKPAT
ncbi:hypothetical protein [Pseudomonas atacamensis]|uniref:hypothetical protein n=1 Tax=Pseudomonas atacamensis TaxID=2565368 RepID=UPI001F2DE694|nr:hypothetical protein [Pseudomonas atacamensis]